ncbi:MAG: ribosomal protein [Candidatus Parcubacteria bacterium]|jgi:large subunit ribosomal protein L21
MFAIIRTGGKQYSVEKGTILKIEKLDKEEGAEVVFDDVLLVENSSNIAVGNPKVEKAKVTAKVLTQGRGKKQIVFKYKNKTRYSVKNGHRQPYTEVEITDITL